MDIVNDTGFYWSHRTLHRPLIYKHVHKKHHMFNKTIGIASEFADPVEELCSNMIPTMLGPVILRVHPYILAAWLVFRVLYANDVHNG